MAIDWFTFFAQIFNFLVLVILLKKFLYRPVMEAMARREEHIANRLAEAEGKVQQSEAEKIRYLALQKEARDDIALEMKKVRKEAEQLREELMLTAKQEVDSQRKAWISDLKKEEDAFLGETSAVIVQYFQDFNRRALQELADEELEARIVEVFLARLENHDEGDLRELRTHVAQVREPVSITTSFVVPPEMRKKIVEKLEIIFKSSPEYRFAENSEVLAGITIEAGGKKIHWDMGEYLKKFEKRLAVYLKSHTIMRQG